MLSCLVHQSFADTLIYFNHWDRVQTGIDIIFLFLKKKLKKKFSGNCLIGWNYNCKYAGSLFLAVGKQCCEGVWENLVSGHSAVGRRNHFCHCPSYVWEVPFQRHLSIIYYMFAIHSEGSPFSLKLESWRFLKAAMEWQSLLLSIYVVSRYCTFTLWFFFKKNFSSNIWTVCLIIYTSHAFTLYSVVAFSC